MRSYEFIAGDGPGVVKAAFNTLGAAATAGIWAPLVHSLPDAMPLIALAGFAGGVTRWTIDQTPIWPKGLGTIVSGVLVAVFLFPMGRPIAEWAVGQMSVEPSAGIMMGAYVTGLLGVMLPMFILDVFGARRRRALSDEGNSE